MKLFYVRKAAGLSVRGARRQSSFAATVIPWPSF